MPAALGHKVGGEALDCREGGQEVDGEDQHDQERADRAEHDLARSQRPGCDVGGDAPDALTAQVVAQV